MSLGGYIFKDAWVLWFLLLLPALAFLYWGWMRKKRSTAKLSGYDYTSDGYALPMHIPFILSLLGIGALLIGLARPQEDVHSDKFVEQFTEGIDIVIAFDVSASMLAMDFEPNRLEASKAVGMNFVKGRKNDRIGLVIYEGESFTQCPLTTDREVLMELFEKVKTGMMEPGTAIGMGLATAINRLRDSETKSKVIILLTDGVNTHGKIHPLAAAEMAKEFGIRVYTIGVGTNGQAKSPVQIDVFGNYVFDYVDVKIDEKTLKEIAQITDGKYFRATDKNSLEEVYAQIDQLEKDKIKTIEYEIDAPEAFYWFVFAGLGLILLAFLTRNLFFNSIHG